MAEPIITKKCGHCKKVKSLSEFYKNRNKYDGLDNYCKSCKKIIISNYNQTEKGKATKKQYQQSERSKVINRKAVKKYHQTEKGKVRDIRYQQSQKCKETAKRYRQSDKGKANRLSTDKSYRLRYPERQKAKNAVGHAVAAGKMSKVDSLQCSHCSAQAQEYHHHKGYAKEHWFDVIPLCDKCHGHARATE